MKCDERKTGQPDDRPKEQGLKSFSDAFANAKSAAARCVNSPAIGRTRNDSGRTRGLSNDPLDRQGRPEPVG